MNACPGLPRPSDAARAKTDQVLAKDPKILRPLLHSVSLLCLTIAAAPALGQDADAPPIGQAGEMPAGDDADGNAEIVVTAARLRGQVETDVPPVLELNEEEIAAYGAGSISELVEQLAPQTASGRGRGGGRPVFLVNGQRVSGFREFSRYPPEAILKVEVLPEEVALQFGYPPDQRVINFILKDNFVSREIEGEYGGPTRGGSASGEVEGSLLRIDGPSRLNLGAELASGSMLTEAERGVIQSPGSVPGVAGDPDPAGFRSLVGDSESVEADASWSTGLGEMGAGGQLTLNGQVGRNHRRTLSGLDTVRLTSPAGESTLRTVDADPITRRTESTSYSLGSALNQPLGPWQLSVTADASRTETDTRIDRRRDLGAIQAQAAGGALAIDAPLPIVAKAGRDRAESTIDALSSLATLRGRPLLLPAGEVSLTLDAGYDFDRIESEDSRGARGPATLRRGALSGGFNLGVPIASRREGFLDAIGDLSLSLSGGLDHLSDFGTLTDWNAGLNWRPTERLSLQGSYIVREVAPGLSQLGGPTIADFNVPVFDFVRGDTVLATITTGGNPALLPETQRDVKLSADYDFELFDRASFRVEYFRNRSDNVTEGFPLLTPAIEAAFPDRVTRAADGTLLAIDRRPVTFARRGSERIRYGINLFGRVGKEPAPGESESGGRRFGGAPEQSAPAAPTSGQAGPQGGSRGAFDPARFAELRQTFCATPEGEVPDLSGIPERMLERLRGEDGQIDPAKVAAMRERLCSADGAAAAQRFDPERFAALRKLLCDDPNASVDLASLPEQVQARLRGPDGEIDQARLAELRSRICAMPAPAAQDGARGRGEGRGAGGRAGGRSEGGPMAFGARGGDGQGRWNVSLYHTIELGNDALVAPGGPFLDLLSGDALGEGGVSRHRIELEGGLFHKGVGLRASGNYRSSTTVNGSGLPGSSDLRFGELATFDLRLFVNLEQQKWLAGETPGLWKGARFSIRANNVFDTYQRVTDDTGAVPLRYQPGLIDPVGRFVEIEFRKMF